MATTTENVNINVNVNSGPLSSSMQQLKKELIELKRIDLDILPPEKQKQVINRMGEVRGKIEDLNYSLKNFDPGDKWGNLGTALRPVATGFAAITSAQMIFGVENEKLQKLQQQFNALISMSMLLQELADSGRLKGLYQYYLGMLKEIFIKETSTKATYRQIIAQNILNISMSAFLIVLASLAATAAIFYVAMNKGDAVVLKFKSSIDKVGFSTEELKNKYDDLKTSIFKNNLDMLKNQGKYTEDQVKLIMLEYETRKLLADNFATYQKELNDKIGTDTTQRMKASMGLILQQIPFLAKWGRKLMLEVGKDAVKDQQELNKQYEDTNKLIIKNYGTQVLSIKSLSKDKKDTEIKDKKETIKSLLKSDDDYWKEILQEGQQMLEMEIAMNKERAAEHQKLVDANKKEDEDAFTEYTDRYTKGFNDELEALNKSDEEKLKEIQRFYSLLNSTLDNQLSGMLSDMTTNLLDQLKITDPELQEGFNALAQTIGQGFSQIISETLTNSTQSQIAALYSEIDNFSNVQNKSLQDLRDRNIITESEYNRRKEQLDKDIERKQRAAKKKAFELEKEEKIKLITIQTALAVISAIAKTPETFGLPFSAFAAAQGLIQAGFVKAQKPPAYAKGHLFNDETYYKNSIVGEAGPEALMSNRATEKYFNLLSSLNTSVGGNSFGGNNNVNELNILNAQMEQLINLTSKQKIVLPVQSLNQVQKDLSRLEATATLA